MRSLRSPDANTPVITVDAMRVAFGFSTLKIRGGFGGKFEVDVAPESLGAAGQTWTETLPHSGFRPLKPYLSPSPDGLKLNEVYSLTLIENAGLELNHVELVPPEKQIRCSHGCSASA